MNPIGRFFGSPDDGLVPDPWYWLPQCSAQAAWQAWARETAGWLALKGADLRDTLVILPVGAVLAQARQAWMQAAVGWVPRIDTIAAVAGDLAWAWMPGDGASGLPTVTLDPVVDRLQAARSLGGEAWGKQWAQRDRRGFEFALDQVVNAAHTWVRRMHAIAPAHRAAYAEAARATVNAGGAQGPGGRERLLLAWALEWAAGTALNGLPADPLFELRPSALVVVTAGNAVSPGTEVHMTLGVMAHLAAQGVPVLWRSAVGPKGSHDGSHERARDRPPLVRACADAEDEAQQAAAQVISAVNERRTQDAADPVALIALDRSLIRRVRAMLDGAGISIADETGWLLSTTRAAAVVTRLLQASHPRASTDDLLDWLKSGWLETGAPDAPDGGAEVVRAGEAVVTRSGKQSLALDQAVEELETWCRRHGLLGAWGLGPSSSTASQTTALRAMPEQATALWQWAKEALGPLQALWGAKRASLKDWLHALHASLIAVGAHSALADDEAGALVLQSLRFEAVHDADASKDLWTGLSSQTRMDGATFVRWVGTVLEATTFRPPAPEALPDVVITPMARAALRPFHAIVLPGADERQLGAVANQSGWLSTKLCEAMDLATPATSRAAQWDAFTLLMSRPGVVCLHRQSQGSEPLEASAWLERWASMHGERMGDALDARAAQAMTLQPVVPPLPSLRAAPWALPEQVTATSYEALRQCPYRFFAMSVLGLRDQDELEEGLDRSDFGIWLHEVLRVFHERRQGQLALSTEAEDMQSWLDAAQEVITSQGFDQDSQRPYFLPFKVDLDRMAKAYVGWLRAHEESGWAVRDAELSTERTLQVGEGRQGSLQVKLVGQLDRVDTRHQEGQRQQLVLDYKTGSAEALKRKVAMPLEDTQLAFYAALTGAAEPAEPVFAAYLHLDVQEVRQLNHEDVAHSAQALLEGLSTDWIRLHEGAPMPALGEGSACNFCQARGLCRKDHWSTPATSQEPQA